MNKPASLYLASASPRRRALLAQLGVAFTPLSIALDETPHPGEAPSAYVSRLAQAKAAAGAHLQPDGLVLGADTTVVAPEGILLGKPVDPVDATRMLTRLQGHTHQVLTAVALAGRTRAHVQVSTAVTLASLTAGQIAAYVASGEWQDKAGGYAIQGLAASFVVMLHGSYTGVVGLPLYETAQLLRRAGVRIPV